MSTSKVTPLKPNYLAVEDKIAVERDRVEQAVAIITVVRHALEREAQAAEEHSIRHLLNDSASALGAAGAILDRVWSEIGEPV